MLDYDIEIYNKHKSQFIIYKYDYIVCMCMCAHCMCLIAYKLSVCIHVYTINTYFITCN